MSRAHKFDVIVAFLSSARFLTVLASASIGVAAFAFALRQLTGWAGLITMIGALSLIWGFVLYAKRGEIEWTGLLPISLLAFVGWAMLSLFWSNYQWASLGSLAYWGGFTLIAIATSLLRDSIQLVRAFGDVLRFGIALSLALEIFAGVLIDSRIKLLQIAGNIASLGPIQGVFGTRNQLGVVSIIALVTFMIELRTKSIRKGVATGSLTGAALSLALSQSPVAIGTALVVGVAAAVLYGLRKVQPSNRRFWNIAIFGTAVLIVVAGWVFRSPLIQLLDATKELDYRLNLWRRIRSLLSAHPIEGWGWIGSWRLEIVPYLGFRNLPGGAPSSAASGYLDVLLQLGIVGFALFLLLIGLAFLRSWLLAVQRRSVVFTWPALILLALIIASLAESSVLGEFCWLTLIVCTVKASREMSWRQAFVVAPSKPELPRTHDQPI